MEARVNAKKRNEAQEAAQREAEIKNRPAGFKFDLCDQEFAQLVIQNTKFPERPFNFDEFSKILTESWRWRRWSS